jgi:signal peptidase I
LLALIAAAVIAAGLGVAVLSTRRRYLFVLVRGLSMAPAFDDGDRVLVRRIRAARIRTGEIVVLRRPSPGTDGKVDGWALYLKRAVAVAGDPVPAQARPAVPTGAVRVPAGAVVVLGDNPASEDSKQWGFVNVDALVGVVVGHHGRKRGR